MTSEIDVLRLTDLDAADVTLTRAGEALKVTDNATGQAVTVLGQFYSTQHGYGIERIDFADGVSWGLQAIVDHTWM